jgi:hypothetical protein
LEPSVSDGDDLVGIGFPDEGLGWVLCSAMTRLKAAWGSTKEWNPPRFSRLRVSSAKKPSTAFSDEQDIGVKWKVQRGWRSSQARALAHFG